MNTRRLLPTLVFGTLLTASLAAAQTTTGTDQPSGTTTDQQQVVMNPRLANVPFLLPAVTPGLSSGDYISKAKEFAAQAAVVYPVAFVDKPLWREAIQNAEAAYAVAATDPTVLSYLANLYSTTQWWYKALVTYQELEKLTPLADDQRTAAAQAAAKVGYIRLSRGLNADAVTFLQTSLNYADSASVRAMLAQAQK